MNNQINEISVQEVLTFQNLNYEKTFNGDRTLAVDWITDYRRWITANNITHPKIQWQKAFNIY